MAINCCWLPILLTVSLAWVVVSSLPGVGLEEAEDEVEVELDVVEDEEEEEELSLVVVV